MYYSKIPIKDKQRPIMVSTPALLGDECCGKNSTQALFWPDTNKFLQKKYRLLEHIDIYF
jgi:hypothetical protein